MPPGCVESRPPSGPRGGRWSALVGAVVVLAVGVPAFALVRWLVVGTSTEFPLDELASRPASTVALALAGAVVTTMAAVPVVWLAVRHRGWASTLIERSTYVANALPGIVVGLALVVASLRLVPAIYQTALLLVVAYTILFLPRAVVTVRAGLEQAPVVLDDVAQSLGAGPTADRATGHPAAHRPEPGRGRRPRLPRHLDRADGHLDAVAHRHPHPGHRVLVGVVRAALRRRLAVRPPARPGLDPRHRLADASGEAPRMSSVSMTDVTRTFGSTTAVDDVSLHVPHGSFTTVLGPCGCGKTTLLRLIAGFLQPESGTIAFGDTVVAGDGIRPMPPQDPAGGLCPPGGCAVPAPRRGRQHRLRARREERGGAQR